MSVDLDGVLLRALALPEGELARRAADAEPAAIAGGEAPGWLEINGSRDGAGAWLQERAGLPEHTCEMLLAQSTLPRLEATGGGHLLILRGVNLNPDAEPEDMVALRCWFDGRRIFTLIRRPLRSTASAEARLLDGEPHDGPLGVALLIATELVGRLDVFLEQMLDEVDLLEDELETASTERSARRAAELRSTAIPLRRHIAPQRDVLVQLADLARRERAEDHELVQSARALASRVMRLVELLDEIRDRCVVAGDHLTLRQTEVLNQRMMLLAMVTGIALPLSLVTGLLGINVGGMPGTESSAAFWVVCAALVVMAAAQFWWLRRNRWL